MLRDYLDMLRKAVEAMTNLGNSGTTWRDYFQAVSFEMLALLIGAAYLLGLALLIAVPIVGVYKIAKMGTAFEKHTRDIYAYREFRDRYVDIHKSLIDLDAFEKDERKQRWFSEAIAMLDSKNIPYEKGCSPENIGKLPFLPYPRLCDICDLPGDFAPIGKVRSYGLFVNFEMMKWMGKIKKAALIILLLSIYAAFVIPLIFMLF